MEKLTDARLIVKVYDCQYPLRRFFLMRWNKHLKVSDETNRAVAVYAAITGSELQQVSDYLLRLGLAQTAQGLGALALADPDRPQQDNLGLLVPPPESP